MLKSVGSGLIAYVHWKKLLCVFLAGSLSIGAPVMAGGPVEIRSTDVTLQQNGLLSGTVLNSSAQPVAGVTVGVLHGESLVATSTSDDEGHFYVKGLRNGAHVIQVGATQHNVRFWGTASAPPSSTSKMAIVVDEQVVRGQAGFTPAYVSSSFTSSTGAFLMIGGATAIVLGTTLGADNEAPPALPSSP